MTLTSPDELMRGSLTGLSTVHMDGGDQTTSISLTTLTFPLHAGSLEVDEGGRGGREA